jgi:SAM-dependent methyltransferase
VGRLAWPLPALLVWGLCWLLGLALLRAGLPAGIALPVAALVGVLGSLWGGTRWRRLMIAAGFPLSWILTAGTAGVAPWVWALPLLALVLLYPPSAWRDAPLFPTPLDAFEGLREALPLPLGARVLDAGCGVGHGLRALERAYPDARLHGVERSAPLAWIGRWRCRGATVRHADLWAEDWSVYDLVYLFQRPETLPRALRKADAELRPGAWLASLEFAHPDRPATQVWNCPDGRPLYLYRAPQSEDGRG